jgi:hypothetical protein
MLSATIRAALWLVSIFTILIYVATTLSQTEPGAGQAISNIPAMGGTDSFADVEAPHLPQRQASGPQQVVPGLAPESVTVAMFWDKVANHWSPPSDLSQGGYSDGETVPSLLRVGDLTPGTVYQVWLDYSGCATPHSSGFDFLGSSPPGDVATDLVISGPGRGSPDARILMPSDVSQAQGAGVFDLWGATFLAAPRGPFPSFLCSENKLIILRVSARSDTIFLLWGSHVAGGGADPEVIAHEINPIPSDTDAARLTLSPVTAIVQAEAPGSPSPTNQD